MIVSKSLVVKQVDKNEIIIDKTTGDKWLIEVLNHHSEVVYPKLFIDIELFVQSLLLCPLFLSNVSKHPQFELSIIEICNRIFGS